MALCWFSGREDRKHRRDGCARVGSRVTLQWLCCMLVKPEEGAQMKTLFLRCDV